MTKFLGASTLGLLVLVAAETGSRVDDWLFDDVPVFGNPSEDDLWTRDAGIRHGQPGARFRKVQLNNFGLIGPRIDVNPPPGCERILFVGSSETFGEPQIIEGDYPARVAHELFGGGCFEVLNGAIPGMSVASIIPFYRSWASKSHPTIVAIYPSTHFYLSSDPPGTTQGGSNALVRKEKDGRVVDERVGAFGILEQSRFLSRLRDSLQIPRPIQKRRQLHWIDAQVTGQAHGWLYQTVPADRLVLLRQHLSELIHAVQESGARPVLITHAVSVASPPRPEDEPHLFAMRIWTPRATESTIAEFPYAANKIIRTLGSELDVPVIDAAGQLSGHRRYFRDMVHFNEDGRIAMAELVAASLPLRRPGSSGALQ